MVSMGGLSACSASTAGGTATAAVTAGDSSAETAGGDTVGAVDATAGDAQADSSTSTDSNAVTGLPAAPTPYAGECPVFAGGPISLKIAGFTRNALITLPAEPNGAGVLFMWHGLGDSAKNFNKGFGAQQIANKLNVIVVTPDVCCNTKGAEGCCSQMTGWHFVANPDYDTGLFDGALHCLIAEHNIDRKRVYTMGFSAGALWSTWLVMQRSAQLAAAAILSGGVNDFNPWITPAFKVPVIDSSGGPADTFGGGLVDFHTSTATMNKHLRQAGHFVVHCEHQMGHTITSDIAGFAVTFLGEHAFDPLGTSPLAAGLPANAPAACKILP